jgi:hypothetical protein
MISFLLSPLGKYLFLAALIASSWVGIKIHYENVGYQKAIHAIAAQDGAAKKEADRAKDTVEKCFADGGDWSVADGVCIPARSGKR